MTTGDRESAAAPTVVVEEHANRTTPRQWRAVGFLAVTAVATISNALDVHWWGRPLAVLAFLLLVPGCALVSAFGLEDDLAEVTVGAATSVALSTAAAMAMLWSHLWHPAVAQVLLAVLSLPLLLAQVRARALRSLLPGLGSQTRSHTVEDPK